LVVEAATREREMPYPKDEYDVLVALKLTPSKEVVISWVEYPGCSRIYEPTRELRNEPLEGITLHSVEVFDVIVYEKPPEVALRPCVHKYCRLYCW
jgi:hypothetical protein